MRKFNTRFIPILLVVFVAMTAVAVLAGGPSGIGPYEQIPFSAQSVWNGPHRDSRNSDFAPFVVDTDYEVNWRRITTAAVFLAPVTGPEGNLYVTSGRGPGTSHLHAFDADGNLLWESPASNGFGSLDAGAVSGAPLVDVDGNVYVADVNQFWSFTNTGVLRWVVPIPAAFISSMVTREGHVGGVSGNGQLFLFNRASGAQITSPLSLPGLPPSGTPPPQPDGLLEGGLLFPDLIDDLWTGFFGFGNEVSNSPAVDAETGRIFIVGSGITAGTDLVYGIDYISNTNSLSIGFQTVISGFSGTSPALSVSGDQVFVSSGDGVMYGINAVTGAINWTRPNSASAYSAAVGPNDIIYTGEDNILQAINASDGSILWSQNYDSLAQAQLPTIPITGALDTGIPEAKINGVVSVSSLHIHVPIILGYDYNLGPPPAAAADGGVGLSSFDALAAWSLTAEPGRTSRMPFAVEMEDIILQQPQMTIIATIDPTNGNIVDWVEVDSTVNGIIALGEFGEMYVEHTAMLSSIFHYGTIPQAAGTEPPVPVAGVTQLRPVSFKSQLEAGKGFANVLNSNAIIAVNGADYDAALVAARRALLQVNASRGSVIHARDNGEIPVPRSISINNELQAASTSLEAAVQLLIDRPVNFAADSLVLLTQAGVNITTAIQLCSNPTAISLDSVGVNESSLFGNRLGIVWFAMLLFVGALVAWRAKQRIQV